MKWRRWRTPREIAADFAKDRNEQSDQEFLAGCGLPDTREAMRIALAVRRSVASYGMVAVKELAWAVYKYHTVAQHGPPAER